MRKLLIGIIAVFVGFIALSQLFLPMLAQGMISSRIKELAQSESVTVNVKKFPAFCLLAGQLDEVDIRADNSVLGDVPVSELTLKGTKVVIPVSKITSAFEIESAEALEMTGVFTEENLALLLKNKVDKLNNVTVAITTELITAKGEMKIAGKTAELLLEGKVEADGDSIVFLPSRIEVKNSRLGKFAMGLLGELELLDFKSLKLPVRLHEVVLEQGFARVIAKRR